MTALPTPTAANRVTIDRSAVTDLALSIAPTALPTPPIVPAKNAATLHMADQLGGAVRMLGEVDGDLIASVGARIHRFDHAGFYAQPVLASSPLLPGMPRDLEVFGTTGVVATTRGLSVLDLAAKPITVLANIELGGIRAVAMHGRTALVALSPDHMTPGQLAVVDVSSPTHPRITTRLQLPLHPNDIAVFKDTAFVSAANAGMLLLDLKIQGEPKLLPAGPWPWTKLQGRDGLGQLEIEDGFLLVLTQPWEDDVDRTCLYVFALEVGRDPSLVQSHTCPFGRVQWVHAVNRRILLRRDERVDVFRIGDPAARSSLDEEFGESQRYSLALTSATRVGTDVIFAPIDDYGANSWIDALRVTVFDNGKLTMNSLWGKVRSVLGFFEVAAEGDISVAISRGGAVNDIGIELLRSAENGEVEQVGSRIESKADVWALDGDVLYAVSGLDLDVYSIAGLDQSPQHVGVLEPRLELCRDEGPNAWRFLYGRGTARSASTHGPLLVVYHSVTGCGPLKGPVVYDVADPRRPNLRGALRGNRLVERATTDGRSLPEPIRVAYLTAVDAGYGPTTAAVAWHAGRAYLAYGQCGGYADCAAGEQGVLYVRDPGLGMDGAPLTSLDLPHSLAMAAQLEVDGVPYLLIGRTGPAPGLYLVSLEQPDAPALVGFFDLPVPPLDIAASGSRVYIADGESGLIVLDAEGHAGE